MKHIQFEVYQIAAPALLLPLSYWLWWERYDSDHRMVFLSLSLPVLFAYIIPLLGTKWLRLWEFDTRLKLGGFRPHHGLVLGAATSLLAFLVLSFPLNGSITGILHSGFVLGSVLGFWNWLYDTYAIKAGFIRVYTRRQSERADAESIATDYAPILFGTFGLCYGISIRSLEYFLIVENNWSFVWPLVITCHAACLITPVLAYVVVSLLRTGETGLRSYERVGNDT